MYNAHYLSFLNPPLTNPYADLLEVTFVGGIAYQWVPSRRVEGATLVVRSRKIGRRGVTSFVHDAEMRTNKNNPDRERHMILSWCPEPTVIFVQLAAKSDSLKC